MWTFPVPSSEVAFKTRTMHFDRTVYPRHLVGQDVLVLRYRIVFAPVSSPISYINASRQKHSLHLPPNPSVIVSTFVRLLCVCVCVCLCGACGVGVRVCVCVCVCVLRVYCVLRVCGIVCCVCCVWCVWVLCVWCFFPSPLL